MNLSALAVMVSLMTAGSIAQPSTQETTILGPRAAIVAAADAAPAAIRATFELRVQRAERVGRRLYLNSERDYRDQRNLTIRIEHAAMRELAARYGESPERHLYGREILVRGSARRTRIDFTDNRGHPTGLYYYQTHVAVDDADQISIAGNGSR